MRNSKKQPESLTPSLVVFAFGQYDAPGDFAETRRGVFAASHPKEGFQSIQSVKSRSVLADLGGYAGEGDDVLVGIHDGQGEFRQQSLYGFDKQIAVGAGGAADDMGRVDLPGVDRYGQGRIVVKINGHVRAELAGDVVQHLQGFCRFRGNQPLGPHANHLQRQLQPLSNGRARHNQAAAARLIRDAKQGRLPGCS